MLSEELIQLRTAYKPTLAEESLETSIEGEEPEGANISLYE